MARFHSLDVVDVRKETRDAVVVTLRPRDEDAALFDFTQGQYLTFRRTFDEDELRRSYSICAGKGDGLTSHLRRRFGQHDYVGIELELNQSLVASAAPRWIALRRVLIDSLKKACVP